MTTRDESVPPPGWVHSSWRESDKDEWTHGYAYRHQLPVPLTEAWRIYDAEHLAAPTPPRDPSCEACGHVPGRAVVELPIVRDALNAQERAERVAAKALRCSWYTLKQAADDLAAPTGGPALPGPAYEWDSPATRKCSRCGYHEPECECESGELGAYNRGLHRGAAIVRERQAGPALPDVARALEMARDELAAHMRKQAAQPKGGAK